MQINGNKRIKLKDDYEQLDWEFCKMIWNGWSSIKYWSLFIICNYLHQLGYYSYLIKIGLGGVGMIEVALWYLTYFARVVQKLGWV